LISKRIGELDLGNAILHLPVTCWLMAGVHMSAAFAVSLRISIFSCAICLLCRCESQYSAALLPPGLETEETELALAFGVSTAPEAYGENSTQSVQSVVW
jgi:hypothetical protein